MSLNIEGKKNIVAEVAGIAGDSSSAVAAEYRGLTVGEMTQLRVEARKADVYLRVVRNTLAKRAVADSPFSCMQDALIGPLVLAFSRQEPSAAPRIMSNFAKDHKNLIIKAGAFNGKLMKPAELETLARMPTRDVAISMLMAVMKAPVGKLARTLAAVRDQKAAA
ncbi:MAG TPA: 50S ribosomal protein L10 [Gammaproteobacteria bacterium]|nr:50S ribosomal protein L10 [Gammaproteobacteria bacterium]